MGHKEIRKMWEAARLNRETLEACAKHHFRVTSILAQHVVCTNCTGRCTADFAYAYAKGYVAHGGAMSDVLIEDLK